jgi:phosphatidylglycerol:prolipoprotein diacylglycerol transferase
MSQFIASITYPPFNPVLFRIGPLAVRWYGLAYLAAFYLGYFGLKRMIKSGRLRLTLEQLSDLFSWLVPGVLLGGRLGWWIFYHRNEGVPEPWYEPIALWHGGMSFHGGLIGVVIMLCIWAWRNKKSILNLADCLALVAPIGLFLGRIANFINAELYGRPTNVPWGVIFPGETFARHPSQLYEAFLEGPMLFFVLWIALKYFKLREGQIAALFLIFYGLFRFLVEFTRQPDEQLGFIALGWLTMGQLLSTVLVLAGIALGLAARNDFRHRDIRT